MRKFKRELNSDFKKYEKNCRFNCKKCDPNIKKMIRSMKFYLWLCPDADYNILELLRKNITKIDPHYNYYQTACYEYLRELAHFNNSDPDNLGFDITLATIDGISSSHHRYFCNVIKRSNSTVTDYIRKHTHTSKPQYTYNNSQSQYSNRSYSRSRSERDYR